MNLFPKVTQGTMMPWWAGMAYYNAYTNRIQLAPIGVAKLWGIGRNIYFWLKGPVTSFERERFLNQIHRLTVQCTLLRSARDSAILGYQQEKRRNR